MARQHDGVSERELRDRDDVPDSPAQVSGKGWFAALKRTFKEFSIDNITDWAAALTYYGVLSIFPGLLVLLALVGLLGQNASQTLTDNVEQLAPGTLSDVIVNAINSLQTSQDSTSGLLAIVGVLTALWSASGYIAAFMRASNAIYDVPEGRPIWKTTPIRVGLTIVIAVLLSAVALGVVLSGQVAEQIGQAVGLGDAAVTAWSIAKWPIMVLIVAFIFALLYWASPNAKQGFKWVSAGGVLAVVVWITASALFAFYVSNFGSYNKTYGSLATVIIFLVWLWISNIALLLGAEFNAELERGRALAAGHPGDQEPYLELRDDSHIKEKDSL